MINIFTNRFAAKGFHDPAASHILTCFFSLIKCFVRRGSSGTNGLRLKTSYSRFSVYFLRFT